MSYRYQNRRDTAANWTATNPVLAAGELGIEVATDGTTRRWKMGDGVTAWTALAYSVLPLATVATTGAWADLTGKPTIPTQPSDIGAQPAGSYATTTALTTGLAAKADATALAAKADGAATTTALAAKADLVGGVIPTAQIPALAIMTTVTVASQAAMLALTTTQVQPGDIAIRTDGAGAFILTATDPTQLASWSSLDTRTDVVTSVNGQLGTIVLGKSDVGLANVDNTHDADKPVSTATAAAISAATTTAEARTNHTGTQPASTITGLAAVATSGTKVDIGLGNVDNTSDVNKPVSTAQASAIATVQSQVTANSSAISANTTAIAARATSAAAAFTGTQPAWTDSSGTVQTLATQNDAYGAALVFSLIGL